MARPDTETTHAHPKSEKLRNRPLTQRERDVLSELVWGKSNDTIAQRLAISRRTVEGYRARIFRKLHVRNVVELVHALSTVSCGPLTCPKSATVQRRSGQFVNRINIGLPAKAIIKAGDQIVEKHDAQDVIVHETECAACCTRWHLQHNTHR